MLDNVNKLELTAEDIELIEAALHTQEKILSVQSVAGGAGAREKLTDLKHLMKRIGRARPTKSGCAQSIWSYLAGIVLGFERKRCHER